MKPRRQLWLQRRSPLLVGRQKAGARVIVSQADPILPSTATVGVNDPSPTSSFGSLKSRLNQVAGGLNRDSVSFVRRDQQPASVLLERTREHVEDAKSTLVEFARAGTEVHRPFDLPDPDDELRAMVQQIVDNEVAHVPMR